MERWRWLAFRLRAVLQRRRRSASLDEELRFHIEEETARLMEAGLPPDEAVSAARRDFGSPMVARSYARDTWTFPRLEQCTRDLAYAWRQIWRAKVRSGAAILALALAVGACLTTFAVMDALLFRPLPVRDVDRLHVVVRDSRGTDGPPRTFDGVEYPLFQRMRSAVAGTTLLAVSYAARADVTYGGDQDIEKATVQYVSGDLFAHFGLRPAAGRLLTGSDDVVLGGHPVAVIGERYWTRRFGRDPAAVGRTLRLGATVVEIVGVVALPFTGTEPGVSVDVLVPAAMHPSAGEVSSSWTRVLAVLPKDQAAGGVRDQLQAQLTAYQQFRSPSFAALPEQLRERLLTEQLRLAPAPSGVSGLQERYRSGLGAMALLVALLLLVACATVGNLMIARTVSRARELALRVSLGAGRRSVLLLVLAECLWIAVLATLLATALAAVAGPALVARVTAGDDPAWLRLGSDLRAVGFGAMLTLVVTLLFGLPPAAIALRVTPAAALQGGQTPRSPRRLMLGLVLVQVAFCVLVVFVGGLLVATLRELSQQPLGFVPQRLLAVQGVSATPRPVEEWERAAEVLGDLPGVERAAVGDRTLLDGFNWNTFVSIDGAPPAEPRAFFRAVGPGYLATVGVPWIDGRDVRPGERQPDVAVVNQAFAHAYYGGTNPVGRVFEVSWRNGITRPVTIVGLVGDARYRDLREPVPPVAYVPFRDTLADGTPRPRQSATWLVRVSTPDLAALTALMRERIGTQTPAIAVSSVRTQESVVAAQTVRERLLATLGAFFGLVALLLSAVGLYGVTDYLVVQRQRDIGICLALGAPTRRVVSLVARGLAAMVATGAVIGLSLGIGSERFVSTLLFGVTATDVSAIALPAALVILVTATACAVPVVRALRTDITATIRAQ